MPRSTSRKSYSRSQSRSRSRTRSRSRSNSRNRNDRNGYGRDKFDDRSYNDLCRVHIADLTEKVSKTDIEKAFGKYGEIDEVWMAKNPPCFAFCVFKNKDDANDAIREMDGRSIAGYRVRVTLARPRIRRSGRGSGPPRRFDSNMRCYQCGQRGHLSRECEDYNSNRKKRRYSRSGSRDRRDRSRTRSYSRSRSASPAPRERKNSETNVEAVKC